MSDLKGLVSIKSIVKETLWLAEKDEKHYKKFLQFAINGFREMNKHSYKNSKRVKLQMDSNYIIPFPDDMVLDVAVYVPINGEWQRLTKKDTLVDTVSLRNGVSERNKDDGENDTIKVNTVGYQAGMHNYYGYYTKDTRNSRFLFVTNYTTEVVLCYITNGISSDNDEVPVLCKEALKSYIMWQNAYFDRSYNLGEKDMYFREYDTQMRYLRNVQAPTLNEMADDIINSATMLPSR